MLEIFTNKSKKRKLQDAIDDVIEQMTGMEAGTDEYQSMIEDLERLTAIKSAMRKGKVSPDTVAIVVGNIVGIVLILGYERINVVASKALGLIIKGRV